MSPNNVSHAIPTIYCITSYITGCAAYSRQLALLWQTTFCVLSYFLGGTIKVTDGERE